MLPIEPVNKIYGIESCLGRPESVEFAPSGRFIVIADAVRNALLFYERTGDAAFAFNPSPAFEIQNDEYLSYPHDTFISPCEQYLGVVCRESSNVVVFRKDHTGWFGNEPIDVLRGATSRLNSPTSIGISETGRLIAVGNRIGSISFFKLREGVGFGLEPEPFAEISDATMHQYNLGAPHGVAFSPDGDCLAVVHKPFFRNRSRGGRVSLAVYRQKPDPRAGYETVPDFVSPHRCNHSIAFHPGGRYLSISDIFTGAFVMERRSERTDFSRVTDIRLGDSENVFTKGIGFSPCGNYVAITVASEDPHVAILDFEELLNRNQ